MVHASLNPLEAFMVALSGIVIVFLMLALLWGVIIGVSRVVAKLEASGIGRKPAAATPARPAPAAPAPAAPAIPPVELIHIGETQAACVMAIISHETGIPLDQLIFKSIKGK